MQVSRCPRVRFLSWDNWHGCVLIVWSSGVIAISEFLFDASVWIFLQDPVARTLFHVAACSFIFCLGCPSPRLIEESSSSIFRACLERGVIILFDLYESVHCLRISRLNKIITDVLAPGYHVIRQSSHRYLIVVKYAAPKEVDSQDL